MRLKTPSYRTTRICFLTAFLSVWIGMAETAQCQGQPRLELFMGADFNYRDINYVRQWDVLLNLTPGFKLNIGNEWRLSGQAKVPIVNQYGNEYERAHVSMMVLSKQLWIKGLYGKVSLGQFGSNRYGLDTKWFLPFSEWMAAESQIGYTGYLSTVNGWEMSRMDRLTWTLGGDIYFTDYNAQLRCVIGRFVYKDYGLYCEAMRHFKHTTVSLFMKYSDRDDLDAGFKAIVMIPPYSTRSDKKIRVRPATNFRFTNIIRYHILTNKMYETDPEENEREGWFDRDYLEWGSHAIDLKENEMRRKQPVWDPEWDNEVDNRRKEIDIDNIDYIFEKEDDDE